MSNILFFIFISCTYKENNPRTHWVYICILCYSFAQCSIHNIRFLYMFVYISTRAQRKDIAFFTESQNALKNNAHMRVVFSLFFFFVVTSIYVYIQNDKYNTIHTKGKENTQLTHTHSCTVIWNGRNIYAAHDIVCSNINCVLWSSSFSCTILHPTASSLVRTHTPGKERLK